MASTEPGILASAGASPVEKLAQAAAAHAAALPPHLATVGASFAPTYRPVLEFDGWKVAMLRRFDVVAPETFHRVERHWNTNEVFLLTAGTAFLILFESGDEDEYRPPAGPGHVVEMALHVAYDVQRSVWHHVLTSPDAHIVLFERAETGPATTDYHALSEPVRDGVLARCRFGETGGS